MNNTKETLKLVIDNMPSDWLRLTTHRLDIYNESLAKIEFIQSFEVLNKINETNLADLPTAFDYIRLGHPLSSILEWAKAIESGLESQSVVSFSSQMMPLMAVLRKNKLLNKKTQIVYTNMLPKGFEEKLIKGTYSYNFKLTKVNDLKEIPAFNGSTLVINGHSSIKADFNLTLYPSFGSIIEVLNNDDQYVKEILHVRRRESIAMTPSDCLSVIQEIIGEETSKGETKSPENLIQTIQSITSSNSPIALGTSGLSVQYAIMMGLVHHANENHSGKNIMFIVPPNCYGGTNDQARRVASCIDNVEIVDLAVDGGKNMVDELELILTDVANSNAIPYIIAEIPTNPRVEVPDLAKLQSTLKKKRQTNTGSTAIAPLFILDQTFCPNVKFFGENGFLNEVNVISYVSGSKFPSGGLCTAGYAAANAGAKHYMSYIIKHLDYCDNSMTNQQIEILTKEMPSMNERISSAYTNTRAFVDFIEETLPSAKINFVSNELASANFTPSVFSLDLPTRGGSDKEKEDFKRKQNHKLISMMIEAIPEESKHCVSYGQLKGCYWTIPATSTQGTTKESDKDYIVRVSVAADFNLEKHQKVFKQFVLDTY